MEMIYFPIVLLQFILSCIADNYAEITADNPVSFSLTSMIFSALQALSTDTKLGPISIPEFVSRRTCQFSFQAHVLVDNRVQNEN